MALEKLLSFSNGVNYALNGGQLIHEECQAWAHGCMLSKLTLEEINAIDLVIKTFGLYSPKTLERISHSQRPWKEKRAGYKDDEAGREVIDEASIKAFYIEHQLNSEETIMAYIIDCIKA